MLHAPNLIRTNTFAKHAPTCRHHISLASRRLLSGRRVNSVLLRVDTQQESRIANHHAFNNQFHKRIERAKQVSHSVEKCRPADSAINRWRPISSNVLLKQKLDKDTPSEGTVQDEEVR
jgi:hypothetical protein